VHGFSVSYEKAYIWDDHDSTGSGEWHFWLIDNEGLAVDAREMDRDGPGFCDFPDVVGIWKVSGYQGTKFSLWAFEDDLPFVAIDYESELSVNIQIPGIAPNTEYHIAIQKGDVTHYYSYSLFNDPPTVGAISGPVFAWKSDTEATFTTTGKDAEDSFTFEWAIDGNPVVQPSSASCTINLSTLTFGDHTISVKTRDALGDVSSHFSSTQFILINQRPTISTLTGPTSGYIGEKLAFTAAASDPDGDALTFEWGIDGDTASFTGITGASFIFSSSSPSVVGKHTVQVRAKDAQGAYSDWKTQEFEMLIKDTDAPTGSISINGGAAYTSSTSVTLALVYSDATTSVTIAQYSNDDINWLDWAGPVATKAWTLASGDGTKTVYYKLIDAAGNTAIFTDTIVLDTVAPTGSIIINGGAATTSSASVTLGLTYSDATSGVYQVQYSNDGTAWSDWEGASATKSWTLTSGDGTKTVYFQIKDNAGLVSSTYSDTITLETPKVATPTFTPSDGQYSSPQNVAISCATSGATIRYTLDGSEPTSSSTAYSSPISVNSDTVTIKAKAFKSGMIDSDTASASYTITPPGKVAAPTFTPVGNTYSSAQSVTISCDTSGATVSYTTDGSDPTSSSSVYSVPIAVNSGTVTVTIKAKAFKTGMTDSDTVTATYIITPPGNVATPALTPTGNTYSSAQTVTISCDTSGATVRYTLDGSEPTSSSTAYSSPITVSSTATVKAKAFKSGMTDSDTVSATYIITLPGKVATPSLSPGGGGYSSVQFVTVSCATSGATIRYTNDGSDPTSSSAVYSSSIAINTGTTTIKAKAYKDTMTYSDTATATYTINTPTPPPTVTPTPTPKPTPSPTPTPTPSPTPTPTPTSEPPTSSPQAQEAIYNLWIILPIVAAIFAAVAIGVVVAFIRRGKNTN
jgi:hypothetical protein